MEEGVVRNWWRVKSGDGAVAQSVECLLCNVRKSRRHRDRNPAAPHTFWPSVFYSPSVVIGPFLTSPTHQYVQYLNIYTYGKIRVSHFKLCRPCKGPPCSGHSPLLVMGVLGCPLPLALSNALLYWNHRRMVEE